MYRAQVRVELANRAECHERARNATRPLAICTAGKALGMEREAVNVLATIGPVLSAIQVRHVSSATGIELRQLGGASHVNTGIGASTACEVTNRSTSLRVQGGALYPTYARAIRFRLIVPPPGLPGTGTQLPPVDKILVSSSIVRYLLDVR